MRALIAFFIIVLLLGIASVNLTAMNFATLPVHRCVAWQARVQEPAADVLFIGTSRTGAGIDPAYIASALSDKRGENLAVDRLITWRSDMVHLNLMARDYLDNRGAPKVVVIELTYLPMAERGRQDLHALELEPRSYQFASSRQLSGLVSDLNGSDGLSFTKGEMAFVAGFASNKFAGSFYHFIRQPLGLWENPETMCAPERRAVVEGPRRGLVFASVGEADPASAAPVEARIPKQKVVPDEAYARPYADNRYENRLFENTATLFKRGGAEKVLFVRLAPYPNIPLAPEAGMDGIPKLPKEALFVDVAGEIDEVRRDRMSRQYRDLVHLTVDGSRDLSDFFAELLEKMLEDSK